MKYIAKLIASLTALCILILLALQCEATEASVPSSVNVIPKPASINLTGGEFVFQANTEILVEDDSNEVFSVARYLAETISPATGLALPVLKITSPNKQKNIILLTTKDPNKQLGPEGYELTVTADQIIIRAAGTAGLFYAAQTIRQLLPTDIESKRKIPQRTWAIPCLTIKDKPRFTWRGSMLDSCRHFVTKDFVKRYIDLLAYHKMNRFHWHLCEDQCWAIEIKKYPKLTHVGAWRGKGRNMHGGYYTQDDIREIIQYAKERQIMVIPEIELPGHCTAALACYPELSCTGGPFEVSTRRGVHKEVYCAGNEQTFKFLEDVLSEVIELFPSPYIHIGGDEAVKDRWKMCPKCQARIKTENLKDENELQSYFVKRIEKFLLAKNKKLIGWDEILEGGLAPSATVQSWRGMKGAIEAARQGHDVIVSPTSHCYIDYPNEHVSLRKIYSLEPVPAELSADQAKHILGAEANMWTDRTAQELIESWAMPRLAGLAEVLWSPKDLRNWDDFSKRMKQHYDRLDVMGIKYYTPIPKKMIAELKPQDVTAESKTFQFNVTLSAIAAQYHGDIFVVFVFDQGDNPVKIDKVALLRNGSEISADNHTSFIGWPNPYSAYKLSPGTIDEKADYTVSIILNGNGGNNAWLSAWLSTVPLPQDIR